VRGVRAPGGVEERDVVALLREVSCGARRRGRPGRTCFSALDADGARARRLVS
jgi:hypothetical protein